MKTLIAIGLAKNNKVLDYECVKIAVVVVTSLRLFGGPKFPD